VPQILVVTEAPNETDSAVVYRERVALADLESDHFSGQLVERMGWALLDADLLEQGSAESPSAGRPPASRQGVG
jgi:hypothetical protein